MLGSNACYQGLFKIQFKSNDSVISIHLFILKIKHLNTNTNINKLELENYRNPTVQGTSTREIYWQCWEHKPITIIRGT